MRYWIYRSGAVLLAVLMGLGIGTLPSGAQAGTGAVGFSRGCLEGHLDEAYNRTHGPVWGELNWDDNGCDQKARPFITWTLRGVCCGSNHGGWIQSTGLISRATASNARAALAGFWLELRNPSGTATKCYRILPSKISWFTCNANHP